MDSVVGVTRTLKNNAWSQLVPAIIETQREEPHRQETAP